ncbi:hypothetical protein [Pacificibacter sp. AS14]|uniref:hypothetical protein n=1 Tax=Pacificibacter sp. AS14 TaxID=3135785 RepID=UPI0031792783
METIEHMLALTVYTLLVLVFVYLSYRFGTLSTDNKQQRGRGSVELRVHQTYGAPPPKPKPRM